MEEMGPEMSLRISLRVVRANENLASTKEPGVERECPGTQKEKR
jgi:hypothetical protein